MKNTSGDQIDMRCTFYDYVNQLPENSHAVRFSVCNHLWHCKQELFTNELASAIIYVWLYQIRKIISTNCRL